MFLLNSIKMWISTEKRKYWFIGFLFFIVLFSVCEYPVMAEEMLSAGADFPPICSEDEYVLLPSGNNHAEIYDSLGNCKGRCRVYLDNAATIKKDSVIEYVSDDTWQVFSMAELKTILELPSEEYSVETCGDVCLTINRNTGKFRLYDCRGDLIYISNEREWAEGEYDGQILGLDNGYLMCIFRSGETGRIPSIGPVWVSKDGQSNKVITARSLIEGFADWSIQSFGDYVFIYDSDWMEGTVYDLDGNVLLDQLFNCLAPYTEDKWNYSSHYFIQAAAALQRADGMYIAYNTKLQEISMFPAEDEDFPDCGYAGGFLQGAAYEQLGGRVCEGFLLYQDRTWQPYAKTEKGYLVYADGQQMELPLESWQNPWYFNESYITASYNGDSDYIEYLIDRKTGKVLQEICSDDEGGGSFELGEDFCIATRIKWEDDTYSSTLSILDENQEICYSQDNGGASTWKNGYIVLRRGIYYGLADREGNWIIRTILGEEE